jgi:hypothetical protein
MIAISPGTETQRRQGCDIVERKHRIGWRGELEQALHGRRRTDLGIDARCDRDFERRIESHPGFEIGPPETLRALRNPIVSR